MWCWFRSLRRLRGPGRKQCERWHAIWQWTSLHSDSAETTSTKSMARTAIDTSVLLCAPEDGSAKQEIVLSLLESTPILSVQVVTESA